MLSLETFSWVSLSFWSNLYSSSFLSATARSTLPLASSLARFCRMM